MFYQCDEIFRHVHVKRYAFDVELLTIASLLSLKVKEMPVDINIECHFKLAEIAKMFLDVLAVSYKYKLCRSYHRQLFSKLRIPYPQEIISAEQSSSPKINHWLRRNYGFLNPSINWFMLLVFIEIEKTLNWIIYYHRCYINIICK